MVLTHNIFPTSVVCGMDMMLKDELPTIYPRLVYDAKYDEKWSADEFDKYIQTIKSLSRSGMYVIISVPHNAIIRKQLELHDVKYCNITPDDTPEMLDYYMQRYKEYHKITEPINEGFMKHTWKSIIGSLKNDTGSVSNIVLDKSTFDGWDYWLSLMGQR